MFSLVPVLQIPQTPSSSLPFGKYILNLYRPAFEYSKYLRKIVSLETINPVRCNFEKVEWDPRSTDDVFAKGILAIDAHNGQWDLILPIF